MKKILLFCVGLLILSSCATGYKAYKKGDYLKASFDAVERLKANPSNEKAGYVLSKSYQAGVDITLRDIENAKQENSPTNYERVVSYYEQLNLLADNIYHSKAANNIIKTPFEYKAELNQARDKAAEQVYDLGMKSLEVGTVIEARNALNLFSRVNNYVYGYKNVLKLIDEARFQGTLRIMFEKPVTSPKYQYSADFFSTNLISELSRNLEKRMIKFYSYENLGSNSSVQPHQYLVLNFEDFSIGNVFDSKKTIDVKRDSVKVGTAKVDGKTVDVYNTVTAKFNTFKREIKSGGILSVRIYDAKNQLIEQRNFSGEYIWSTSWNTYNGDDRALTAEQKALCEKEPQLPPSQQNLFVEFTKPIYSQAYSYIRYYYSKW
jgi:hypothetical protein